MQHAIPVVDLDDMDLEAVRAGTEELGAIQVVNHGVPTELIGDLERRMARLLGSREYSPGAPSRRGGGPATLRGSWGPSADRVLAESL